MLFSVEKSALSCQISPHDKGPLRRRPRLGRPDRSSQARRSAPLTHVPATSSAATQCGRQSGRSGHRPPPWAARRQAPHRSPAAWSQVPRDRRTRPSSAERHHGAWRRTAGSHPGRPAPDAADIDARREPAEISSGMKGHSPGQCQRRIPSCQVRTSRSGRRPNRLLRGQNVAPAFTM
jgi:hypothetical protein